MDFKELETQIKELIAKDEMETAIKLMVTYFQKDSRLDEIILQSGRYFALRKEQMSGTADREELNKNFNQLRMNILGFLKSEQEESAYKSQVFGAEAPQSGQDLIPVFFSLGSPHKESQVEYVEKLKEHLSKYQVGLISLEEGDWDNLDPLSPIRRKMEKCCGCLSLAMERSFVKEGIVKRESHQEKAITNQSFATPWMHIEATLAYQLELPFLILKEKDIRSEGMLDDSLFEWRIVKIDPTKPQELEEYPIKSFIRMWVEEIKKFQAKKAGLQTSS